MLSSLMAIIFLAAAVMLVVALLSTFATFDELVQRQYERHPDAWRKDGSPHGVFWSPEGSMSFAGWLALNRCFSIWLFWAPPWMPADDKAAYLLRKFRYLAAACILICLLLWATVKFMR
jgi:hypothetical protein